ncbi:MAG: HlyD family type I secretion periplasmic adaptor subunit [Pseudomonadota bacterium]
MINQNALTLTDVPPDDVSDGLSTALKKSRILLATVVFGLGAPLALLPMSSSVMAPGEITVASRVKKIAHPQGGVIAEIPVSNGTRVRAGQLLMRLDTNVSAASAAMTVESLDQLTAREARLRAERDAYGTIEFPPALLARANEALIAKILSEERRIFQLNRATVTGQRAALQAQIEQASKAIGSYIVQANVYRKQEALIAEERVANEQLWEKRYTTLQRRNELARSAVGLRGSVASAEAQASQLRSKIAELREQTLVLEDEARRQAGTELAQVQSRLIELKQSNIVAQDINTRNQIRAPYDGVVDKLAYTTIGGVVRAGETIMEIVPERDPLIVTAKVSPSDVDQLVVGQKVRLRLSAFNLATTPELEARLSKFGADRTVDPQQGVTYYTAEIEIPDSELQKLEDLKLRPGMPAEAFIQTGSRTMLNYLFKPLTDQFARAFR